MKWYRARFTSDSEDCRPIYTGATPEGPWWISGASDDGYVIVAFVKSPDTILKQWPEAKDIDSEEVSEVTFSGRFPKPDWWIS